MNILVVSQYYYPEQFRINDIAEQLVKQGHKVTVLTGLPNYPLGRVPKEYKFFRKRKETVNGVKVLRVPLIGRRDSTIFLGLNYISFMTAACLKALFLKKDFDCIYVYQLSPVLMAAPGWILKKLTKKPLLLYCLDVWPEAITCVGVGKESRLYRMVEKVSRFLYKKCDFIQTTSILHKDYLHKEIGIDPSRLGVLYQHETEDEETDASMDLGEGFHVIYVGNLGKIQSMETILQAARVLQDLPIRFHIMGAGSELDGLKRMKEEMGLNRVEFYGKVDFAAGQHAIRQADCSVMAIKKGAEVDYPFPGKVQSYLKNGSPIVAAMSNEAADFLNENNCGLCCRSEDYEAMAEHIRYLFEHRETLAEYRKNAARVFLENFSTEHFIRSLCETIDGMV